MKCGFCKKPITDVLKTSYAKNGNFCSETCLDAAEDEKDED